MDLQQTYVLVSIDSAKITHRLKSHALQMAKISRDLKLKKLKIASGRASGRASATRSKLIWTLVMKYYQLMPFVGLEVLFLSNYSLENMIF